MYLMKGSIYILANIFLMFLDIKMFPSSSLLFCYFIFIFIFGISYFYFYYIIFILLIFNLLIFISFSSPASSHMCSLL